jgi:hypothetical protein
MPKGPDIKSILIICGILFPHIALAQWIHSSDNLDEPENYSFALGDNRTLVMRETDHYAWSEGYKVEISYTHGKSTIVEPLVIDREVHGNIIKDPDNILQSSGEPEFKDGFFNIGARVGPDDECDSKYKLESSPAKNGTQSHHLVLLSIECKNIGLDGPEDMKTTYSYTRK